VPLICTCRDYTDISIAVATPKGLVVPVLRSVDKLSFAEVEKVRQCGLLLI
jgi:pyruvate/2-oxoglutarate dehydrogenase complex dihydrolipoamide acyltransferase (E2) component